MWPRSAKVCTDNSYKLLLCESGVDFRVQSSIRTVPLVVTRGVAGYCRIVVSLDRLKVVTMIVALYFWVALASRDAGRATRIWIDFELDRD